VGGLRRAITVTRPDLPRACQHKLRFTPSSLGLGESIPGLKAELFQPQQSVIFRSLKSSVTSVSSVRDLARFSFSLARIKDRVHYRLAPSQETAELNPSNGRTRIREL
jgi:hypothetical protein